MRVIVALFTAILGVSILAFAGGFLLMLVAGIVWAEFTYGAPLGYWPAVALFTSGSLLLNFLRSRAVATLQRKEKA